MSDPEEQAAPLVFAFQAEIQGTACFPLLPLPSSPAGFHSHHARLHQAHGEEKSVHDRTWKVPVRQDWKHIEHVPLTRLNDTATPTQAEAGESSPPFGSPVPSAAPDRNAYKALVIS